MTPDTRNNLIIAALAISLIAHLVAMFWAKPKVMTHVASGIARMVWRGPMRVTEAATRPEPVAIEVMLDEEAKKEAPKCDETLAILPSDEIRVACEAHMISPDVMRPDVLSQLAPKDSAPRVEASVPVIVSPSSKVQKFSFDMPHMAASSSPSLALPHSESQKTVPVFEAPVFAPVGSIKEVIPNMSSADRAESTPKEVFKPMSEVMPEVDTKLVEAEKGAVRDLMNSVSSVDMHSAVDVTLTAHTQGSWTYFKVRVRPKPRLPCVPKDVVILIDASGSIGHDRLASCRKAAREILRTAMNTGDRFNLVAFRDKFSYAFKSWQPCDASSYAAGDRWMSRLAAHGRTDVFATISSVLTLPRDPTRPLVALVVTDGDANAGVSETSEILSKFSRLNDGLISVFMYGVKSSANRDLIDVLTHGNRGECFIFEGWRWNAGEGIGAFSERFRDPIITDLRFIFTSQCAAEVYPKLLKNLYRNNTVELVGRTPGRPSEICFSLRGLAGSIAHDGIFRLPIRTASSDSNLPAAWAEERAIEAKLR